MPIYYNMTYCISKDSIVGIETPENVLYYDRLASIHIGSFQPDTSKTDFIEFQTKSGGSPMRLSMSIILLLNMLKIVPAMFHLTTGDLNLCLIVPKNYVSYKN